MKSERKAPSLASFVSVASICDNTLIEAKLEYFVAVAKLEQEFLLRFETKAQVTPFLPLSLKDLLLAIMDHFKQKEVLEKIDTFKKLSTIDPADKKNQKNPKHVDICFAARGTLKKLQVNYVFCLSEMIALRFCLLL